ncbi:MAG TPA: deoxyribodipyrimidine photo-lyase [Candidatus Binatia bacterium]
MRTVLHWFRRDLRLADNTALTRAAAGAERLLPVFVIDDAILARPDTGAPRVVFLFGCLHALAGALAATGSRLVVLRGAPERELPRLARTVGAAAVHWNKDYEPYARARDARVAEALRAAGVASHQWKDHVLFEEREILTAAGTPFTVFTPYARAWARGTPASPMRRAPLPPPPEGVAGEALPTPEGLGLTTTAALPEPGERPARRVLARFVQSRLKRYSTARNAPGKAGTSELSPYLRFGVLSIRTAYAAVAGSHSAGARAWRNELAWRDFYCQILFHHPNVEREAFRPAFRTLGWTGAPAHFEAWCRGETGYPIVDAAMRQLDATAWMHNRARMIAASFLTKDLLIDWRQGERWFMQRLVDGDLAANNGGWQWAASTGTDAQPFFRIFNPSAQGERFDPDGAYVRRWVPELAGVPARWIHRPWEMPGLDARAAGLVLGGTYPERLVRHEEQRPKALALYGAARAGQGSGAGLHST